MIRQRLGAVLFLVVASISGRAQSPPTTPNNASSPALGEALETTEARNRRLEELVHAASARQTSLSSRQDYHIGPEDLVTITVFEATELNLSVRVSANGEISLPLLGSIQTGGMTPRELELVLQELLRRSYVKDPHVNVLVSEMQSHPVSVMGAVKKPGVYQIRGAKTLLEILSMAEGLADDAGDTAVVMRGGQEGMQGHPTRIETERGPAVSTPPEGPTGSGGIEVNLRNLLGSGDARYDVPVYPGDIVKVQQAGIVYVVGEVHKPGGFPLKNNEKITVVQGVALGEGLTATASKGNSLIIRTQENGQRVEIPVDLGKILKGQAPDPWLQAKDVLFVPNSTPKSVGKGTFESFARVFALHGILFGRK